MDIKSVARETPDPVRAEKNLERFFSKLKDPEAFREFLNEIALLFSYSQFLSNYSIQFPDRLLYALQTSKEPITRKLIREEISDTLPPYEQLKEEDLLRWVRFFKKDLLLRVTLRDLLGLAETDKVLEELTFLAEGIIEGVLRASDVIMRRRFGDPPPGGGGLVLIGVGKLGGEDLNYSSDVDLVGVYGSSEGETSGQLTPSGVRVNRISTHEYYNKLLETLSRILSQQTPDGIGYRCDLRLRPQGQRGPLAQPLDTCRRYYENWARTWERMVMIRARPVAGDRAVGDNFMEIIQPFVWKSPDYTEIDEIRGMKKKIDSTFSKEDIKRGYGGIREIEFFVQTFQLLYGTEIQELRTNRLGEALRGLSLLKGLDKDELRFLWKTYLYLRKIENYLQMRDDLQIHKLPDNEDELGVLGRKMGYGGAQDFLRDLRVKRMGVKDMYNSLLGTEEDVRAEALGLLETDLKDEEIRSYLTIKGFTDPEAGLKSLRSLREQLSRYRSQKERRLLRGVLPVFLDEAMRAPSPERALRGIEQFFSSFGRDEAYLEWFSDQQRFLRGIVKLFSMSVYLGRVFLSNPIFLDLLMEGMSIKKRKREMQMQLMRYIRAGGENYLEAMVEYKKWEELRTGLLFFSGYYDIRDLMRMLSLLAETVVQVLIERHAPSSGLLAVGMGKLGGREITYGSDLDIIYIADAQDAFGLAEEITRELNRYTPKGQLYEIDLRLRPDGSKGTIVKSMEGLRNYYLKSAQPWEVQALLKARPIAGTLRSRQAFLDLRTEVLEKRGGELRWQLIEEMRQRIISQVSDKEGVIDLKFGPGGLEDIEFFTQWLQISGIKTGKRILVSGTLEALKRLSKWGVITEKQAVKLSESYIFLRTVETYLKLDEMKGLKRDTQTARGIARLLGMQDETELIDRIAELREDVIGLIDGMDKD